MKVRYKSTGAEAHASSFNIHALDEVLTGDDSPFISDLDIYLEAIQNWMDMSEAFKLGMLITNNHNTCFFEPKTQEDKERGYTLT